MVTKDDQKLKLAAQIAVVEVEMALKRSAYWPAYSQQDRVDSAKTALRNAVPILKRALEN